MESAKGQDQVEEDLAYGIVQCNVGKSDLFRRMAIQILQRQRNFSSISACMSLRKIRRESTSAVTVPINTFTSAKNPANPNSAAVASRQKPVKILMPPQRSLVWR